MTEATYARVSKLAEQKTKLRARYACSYIWIEYIESDAIAKAMHQNKFYESSIYFFCIAVSSDWLYNDCNKTVTKFESV